MADIDADLLALAGDSSSDEGEAKETTAAVRSESPVSAKSSSPARQRSREFPAKSGVAKKRITKSGTGTRHVARRARKDDSEEEGEASSDASSRPSLQSASMSESESDSDAMGSHGHLSSFPLEGKFTSAADKAEIMALPEIKREEILAERATVVEREQQNRMLVQLLRDKERKENKEADKKKRKAGAADLEEGQRKSSRQKTTLGGRKVGEASAPMEAYKRQREQRNNYNEQRRREEDGRAADRKSFPDKTSDIDAEGEEDFEWDDGKARNGMRASSFEAKDAEPAVLRDFERAKIGRTGFAKVCFYPGFEEAITGCPVRINIGVDKATGENIYRVAQIKRFTEGKPYAMQSENGKQFVTSQYALAAHGKAEKDWPFIVCSNAHFTEAEFERYKRTCAAESVTIAAKTFLDGKVDDINSLLNRSWTEAEIQEKLRRQGVLANREPLSNRNAILQRRDEAVVLGDEAAIAKCDAELAALESPKLAFGTSLTSSPSNKVSKGPTQQERLAALNRANRKANTAEIRKAQLAEKRAEAQAQAAVARGEALANPFARVKTRARVMHDVSNDSLAPPSTGNDDLFESDRSRAVTPLSTGGANTPGRAGTPRRSGTPLKSGASDKKGGLPTIKKKNMDDDLIAALDLGIDIEL